MFGKHDYYYLFFMRKKKMGRGDEPSVNGP